MFLVAAFSLLLERPHEQNNKLRPQLMESDLIERQKGFVKKSDLLPCIHLWFISNLCPRDPEICYHQTNIELMLIGDS